MRWLFRANRLRRATLLLSSAAFGLGLILQPVLGQLSGSQLNTPEKLMIATSAATAYTVVVGMVAVVSRERENREHFLRTIERLAELEARTGMTVEFLPRGDGATSDPYQVVTQLVASARSEILVLDHRVPKDSDRFSSHDDLRMASRKGYYELFTRRVTERLGASGFLRYRRIVQLESGPTTVWDSGVNGDQLFADHCRAVVRLITGDVQCPSAIKTSSVFFPNASIVIIDGTTLLLEVAIAGPDGQTRVQGDLIFRDTRGTLALPIRQLFEHIDVQATLVATVL